MLKKTRFIVFTSLLLLVSCRKSSQVISVVKDHYTIQEQKTLGKALDAEYQKNFSILEEAQFPEAYAYLSTLFEMIIRTPSVQLRDSLDWQVNIIHNDLQYQIFVSPSGSLYISTGLLHNLNAENQLVALLSHQVAYIESEAAFNLVRTKNDAIEVGKVVLGEESMQLPQMANTLLFTSYPTLAVQKADEFQVSLLCPFKYKTTGMIDVFHNSTIHSSLNKTMPWSNERATNLVAKSAECGSDDSLFVERYTTFRVQTLPN